MRWLYAMQADWMFFLYCVSKTEFCIATRGALTKTVKVTNENFNASKNLVFGILEKNQQGWEFQRNECTSSV